MSKRRKRADLIDALVLDGRGKRAVLEGLPRKMLERLVDLDHANMRLVEIGRAYRLPGEQDGHSIYAIAFEDGAAYVGMTGQMVMDRLEDHFGEGERGGFGTLAIVERRAAGLAYRFKVLASGLTQEEARWRRDRVIRALEKPLNGTANARSWRDPLALPPEQGAVARYHPNGLGRKKKKRKR